MENKWITRAYRDGDEEGILELWKTVYPEKELDGKRWIRWWRWMYKENPAGKAWIWLADDGNKIVGQAAFVPVLMKIGTELVVGFQTIDAMTHPDYRHQGIFFSLSHKAYEATAQDNVHIGYGFSNDNSYPIAIKKLNCLEMPKMKVMVKVFNWKNVIKLKTKSKFSQIVLAIGADLIFNKALFMIQRGPAETDLTINQVTHFDERFDELWNNICGQAQIMTVRKKEYLNWRYHAPDTNYIILAAEKNRKIYGYLVMQNTIKPFIKESIIFDIIAQSEEIMHCLVSRALEECRQNNTDMIFYSSITNRTYHKILKKNGFISPPFIKGGYFSVYSSSSSISKDFLSDSQNWLINTGDSDTI